MQPQRFFLIRLTVKCKWEMTLSGECPAMGGGSLTLQADGTLLREHQMPDFTASGPLTRRK